MHYLGRPRKLRAGDSHVVATARKAWLEELNCLADCRGLFNGSGTGPEKKLRKQQLALLLYRGRLQKTLTNQRIPEIK